MVMNANRHRGRRGRWGKSQDRTTENGSGPTSPLGRRLSAEGNENMPQMDNSSYDDHRDGSRTVMGKSDPVSIDLPTMAAVEQDDASSLQLEQKQDYINDTNATIDQEQDPAQGQAPNRRKLSVNLLFAQQQAFELRNSSLKCKVSLALSDDQGNEIETEFAAVPQRPGQDGRVLVKHMLAAPLRVSSTGVTLASRCVYQDEEDRNERTFELHGSICPPLEGNMASESVGSMSHAMISLDLERVEHSEFWLLNTVTLELVLHASRPTTPGTAQTRSTLGDMEGEDDEDDEDDEVDVDEVVEDEHEDEVEHEDKTAALEKKSNIEIGTDDRVENTASNASSNTIKNDDQAQETQEYAPLLVSQQGSGVFAPHPYYYTGPGSPPYPGANFYPQSGPAHPSVLYHDPSQPPHQHQHQYQYQLQQQHQLPVGMGHLHQVHSFTGQPHQVPMVPMIPVMFDMYNGGQTGPMSQPAHTVNMGTQQVHKSQDTAPLQAPASNQHASLVQPQGHISAMHQGVPLQNQQQQQQQQQQAPLDSHIAQIQSCIDPARGLLGTLLSNTQDGEWVRIRVIEELKAVSQNKVGAEQEGSPFVWWLLDTFKGSMPVLFSSRPASEVAVKLVSAASKHQQERIVDNIKDYMHSLSHHPIACNGLKAAAVHFDLSLLRELVKACVTVEPLDILNSSRSSAFVTHCSQLLSDNTLGSVIANKVLDEQNVLSLLCGRYSGPLLVNLVSKEAALGVRDLAKKLEEFVSRPGSPLRMLCYHHVGHLALVALINVAQSDSLAKELIKLDLLSLARRSPGAEIVKALVQNEACNQIVADHMFAGIGDGLDVPPCVDLLSLCANSSSSNLLLLALEAETRPLLAHERARKLQSYTTVLEVNEAIVNRWATLCMTH